MKTMKKLSLFLLFFMYEYETFSSVKTLNETFDSNDTFSEIDKSSSKAYFFCSS